MAAAQKFSDPQMPFHREVHNGCAIGTSIIVKAKAYQDTNKTFILQLKSRNDIALNLSVPVNKAGNMTANARINDNYTSDVQKPVNIPLNTPFALHVRLDTYVAEIYLNDAHIMDFVHRVNPLEIKEVTLEGPLIVAEVLFRPPQGASLEQLPTYDQASNIGGPIPEFQNLSIGSRTDLPPPPPFVNPVPPRSVAPPPAGTVIPPMAASQAPYPEKNYPGAPPLPKKDEMPGNKGPSGYPPPPGPQQPVAQIAPQPAAPLVSNIATQQNQPPTYPPNVPAPGGYVPPATYPSAPPATYPQQTYPQQKPNVYPGGPNAPPQQPPTMYPGPNGPQVPNVYPGPNQPPQQPNVYPGPNQPPIQPYNPYQQPSTSYIPQQAYPQQQPVYPVYQQGYPAYAPQTYPVYSYPSVYYDDCHHHHHC